MHLLSTATGSLTSLFFWLAVLLCIVGVLLAALSFVRRRMNSDFGTPKNFSLVELRALHREGKLTDDEFEKAKSLLVGKVHTQLAKEVKPTLAAQPLNADVKSEKAERP